MASIYKRGDRWYLQWRQGDKQIKRSLGKITKDQAETIKYAKEVELRTGERILQQNVVFGIFAKEYLSWHKFEYPDSHDRVYQITHQHLIPLFEFHSLATFPIQSVEAYKRSRDAAVETINKELRVLKAIINKAVQWGYIPRNPIKSVKAIKSHDSSPRRFYTASELDLIYANDALHADIWRLMANTGLRRAEALALKWENVFASSIRVLSTSKDRTKSGKWREIPISPGARLALNALQKNQQPFVLPRCTGRSLTRAFGKALDRSGLEGSLHSLRHTFCSHLVMSGVPLRTVQVLAGHHSYTTTEKYAHLAPDHLQATVAKLHL